MPIPEPYGIHTLSIRDPYGPTCLRSRRNGPRSGHAAPSRRKGPARRVILLLSTGNPHVISTACPQLFSMLQCYFLEGIGAICDGFITAGGDARNHRRVAKGQGSRSGAVPGLRNRVASAGSLTGRDLPGVGRHWGFPGRQGRSEPGFIPSGKGPANWEGVPSGPRIRRASGTCRKARCEDRV
jgi:hypothetical protein